MLMPGLVRTPVQRKYPSSRTPNFKPSTSPGLPVAGLQVPAKYPAKTVLLRNLVVLFYVAIYRLITPQALSTPILPTSK